MIEMKWPTPLTVRNASKEDLVEFILSMMAEDDANQLFTDWALSDEQTQRFLTELMGGNK
jgi:hypothetical protein